MDHMTDGARDREGGSVWSLPIMLPYIPCNRDDVLLLLGIVEVEDGGVMADVRGMEEGGDAGVGKHPIDNDLVGVGNDPD